MVNGLGDCYCKNGERRGGGERRVQIEFLRRFQGRKRVSDICLYEFLLTMEKKGGSNERARGAIKSRGEIYAGCTGRACFFSFGIYFTKGKGEGGKASKEGSFHCQTNVSKTLEKKKKNIQSSGRGKKGKKIDANPLLIGRRRKIFFTPSLRPPANLQGV